jgi:hypothetical protein
MDGTGRGLRQMAGFGGGEPSGYATIVLVGIVFNL